MTNLIARIGAKLGLAAIIALTGLSATVNTAAASEPRFGMYVQHNDRDRGWDRHHGRRHDRHHGRPGCSPWRAEDKASRMGLRRARVVDVSRRAVVVAGRGWHGRDRIVFANERGCPVIRR
ncbi:hypothetical protein SAMN03159496_04119 [Rhizobium sp. NFR07]|uniref:hypothetical protein n=1 Tax=Rhizobium sp. NFR07 TaxID=1566262 RepID=UPI0008F1C160|nr:hypothetical protein [Rhizobium sp. NFR07]SFB48162.1 hypothetical protein SAMN03159496_04119 [Rhizobium sp. NFR07]